MHVDNHYEGIIHNVEYVCALHEFDMSCIGDMHIGAQVGAKVVCLIQRGGSDNNCEQSYALYKEMGATKDS